MSNALEGRLDWLCLRLSLGCYSRLSASRLQSADVSLVLTGPEAPLWSQQPWVVQTADLLVLLHYVTDGHLAGLLPGLKDRLTGLAITRE